LQFVASIHLQIKAALNKLLKSLVQAVDSIAMKQPRLVMVADAQTALASQDLCRKFSNQQANRCVPPVDVTCSALP